MAYYFIVYECNNCDWNYTKSIERGKLAPSLLECPYCGCLTARRKAKSPLPPTFPPISKPILGPWPFTSTPHLF